jgi:pyruvate/2-oxoglutarate dehydrogenase complex dihydrolipoamide dehydrogenase (E3) component
MTVSNVPLTPDLCILGAGSAGLSIAAGAAQMGAKVVLIEAHRMGGDCLNTGCVPSKSLLAAAKAAQTARSGARLGVHTGEPRIDFTAVHGHVQGVIAGIAPHDSVERFTGLGCTVIQARGQFIDKATVEAGGQRIRARRFIIATGSRAAVPPIPGLAGVPYMTNESLFDNTVLPAHLIVIGGGPIGCEMAQAHRRLGSNVTIIDLGKILPKDDPEAAEVVRHRLTAEGVNLIEGAKIARVEGQAGDIAVVLATPSGESMVRGSHLLVAAGRRANVDDLGLDAAGVAFTPRGITVDARLRSTTNNRVYAAGDVAGGYQFTHLAGYHAGIIIRNVLFRIPAKAEPKALPWVTYTDPELAQVGLTEAQAKAADAKVRILRAEFGGNDRAQADGATDGFLKAMVAANGKILGATIVGHHAGELIMPWVLAMSQGLKIGALANAIAPYPTLSEISKRAAGSYYTPTLFSSRTRAIVRFLGAFG